MAHAARHTHRVATENRRARRDYFIDERFEVGLVLAGGEVKSLRAGKASLTDAYAGEKAGEIWLFTAYIPEYAASGHFGHEPRRPRKLLLHRRQIKRLIGVVKREGVTLVPLKIYFNARGIAKVDLGLARGKRKYDKREAEKTRDWARQKARLMREKG